MYISNPEDVHSAVETSSRAKPMINHINPHPTNMDNMVSSYQC